MPDSLAIIPSYLLIICLAVNLFFEFFIIVGSKKNVLSSSLNIKINLYSRPCLNVLADEINTMIIIINSCYM